MMGPRNWKWMVPAILAPVSLVIFIIMFKTEAMNGLVRLASLIPAACIYILLLSARKNYRAYFEEHEAWVLETRQKALATTTDTELAKTLAGLHPAYAKLLTMHTQTVWMLREGKTAQELGMVDYLLYGTRLPVRMYFVAHVLKNSNGYSVMPVRLLSDGSKQFDPDGLITDREQYDELIAYWKNQGRVTGAYGSQPAQWLYPWTAQAVADAMNMDLDLNVENKNEEK